MVSTFGATCTVSGYPCLDEAIDEGEGLNFHFKN